MQFSIVNCFRGLSCWLSARFLTLLMLAGVRARWHVPAWMTTCPLSVERFYTAGHVNFFYLKVLFPQYSMSVYCPETSCTNMRLHNRC